MRCITSISAVSLSANHAMEWKSYKTFHWFYPIYLRCVSVCLSLGIAACVCVRVFCALAFCRCFCYDCIFVHSWFHVCVHNKISLLRLFWYFCTSCRAIFWITYICKIWNTRTYRQLIAFVNKLVNDKGVQYICICSAYIIYFDIAAGVWVIGCFLYVSLSCFI